MLGPSIKFHYHLLLFQILGMQVLKFDPYKNWLFNFQFGASIIIKFLIYFFLWFIVDNAMMISSFNSFHLYLLSFCTPFLGLLGKAPFNAHRKVSHFDKLPLVQAS